MEHALICPQCGAPLSPHRFARSIVCSHCGTTVQIDEMAVSAERFHKAFLIWNSPVSYQIPSWVSIDDHYWEVDDLISQGDIADVYLGRRARWPTELVILKILRDHNDAQLLDNEWNALQILQQSDEPGADTFTALLPQPILHDKITNGMFTGKQVSVFRWAVGFQHNFEEVMRVYPQGIPPRASIWIWRRILEILSFIHASGMVHGAVLPAHLLVQENEHGIRLVDYSFASKPGEKVDSTSQKYNSFYPNFPKLKPVLTPQLDIIMSARCIAAILGGNPETAELPLGVPPKLAEIVQRIALSPPNEISSINAWAIRDELGIVAENVFGPPEFIPIVMPV